MTARAPLIIAGACGYGCWPDNSLEGFARSLDAGVDGVEVDVHLSADGHVVLYHDYRLDPHRTRRDGAWINAPGPVLKSLTLDELRRYDVGRAQTGSKYEREHPHQQPMDNVTIGTLSEALGLLRAAGHDEQIYIEIKTTPQEPNLSSDPNALSAAVLEQLSRADLLGRARVIAFDWRVLRTLRTMRPELATSHLSIPPALQKQIKRSEDGHSPWADGCDPVLFAGSVPRAIAAHGGQCWSAHFSELSDDNIAEAKAAGLAVAAWGLSRAEDIEGFYSKGLESLTVSGPYWGAHIDRRKGG